MVDAIDSPITQSFGLGGAWGGIGEESNSQGLASFVERPVGTTRAPFEKHPGWLRLAGRRQGNFLYDFIHIGGVAYTSVGHRSKLRFVLG